MGIGNVISGMAKLVAEEANIAARATKSAMPSGTQFGLFGEHAANSSHIPGARFGALRQQVLASRAEQAARSEALLNSERTFQHTVNGVKQTGGPALIPGKEHIQMDLPNVKAQTTAAPSGPHSPIGTPFRKDALKEASPSAKPFDHIWNEKEGAPWQKLLKTFGNAATGAGMSNRDIWNSALTRAIMPAAGGALSGAIVGGVGGLMFPGNVEYQGVMGGAIKGAMMGAGLGMMGRGAGAMVKKLSQSEFQHMGWLNKPASMISKVGESKAYSGAIAAATGFMGASEINLTRPLNPQGY